MPLEFIRQKVGSQELDEAVRQQQQLSYFTQSSIQEEVTSAYFENWAERNYSTNDHFLNFVKQVFRTDNFISFFKFFRSPIASAELVNERVKTPLARVFFSEDSYFKYFINGESKENIPELDSKKFNEQLFDALLFRHNDIVVTGLKDINTPFREIIDIANVVAIDSRDNVINRIAYTAKFQIEGVIEKGWLFIDAFRYIFYYDDGNRFFEVPHDLGECPADYIAREKFSDKDAVRLSLFSYVREKMEEYVFLKTLQRMTEPNGAIPIVTMLDTKIKGDDKDIKGSSEAQPTTSNIIGSQVAEFGREVQGSQSILQTGSQIKVPIIKKDDGSVDMDAVKDFLNFFHIPTEALEYLSGRIKEIEQALMVSLTGDFVEPNEASKNELQISKSFINKQDKLRSLSLELTRIRNLSDFKFLALQHGKNNVEVDCFYGSDFFLESQEELFNLFEKSPNPIERKNLLIKSSRNKNRFNRMKMEREIILYHLLPYCSDKDFDKATSKGIDQTLFDYQTRFNYWIGAFEAEFGDILIFWETLEGEDSEKLIIINNLILNIIKKNESSKSTSV